MCRALKKSLCLVLTLVSLFPAEIMELSAVDWTSPRINSYNPNQASVNVDLAFDPLPDFSVLASDLQSANNDLIVDFGSQYGLFSWDGNEAVPWTYINRTSPERIAGGDFDGDGRDEAIVDFDSQYGIFLWDPYATETWTYINRTTAKSITVANIDDDGRDEAIVDFGPQYGIFLWDPYAAEQWTYVNTTSANVIAKADIDGDFKDELIIDFGPQWGVFTWDPDEELPWTHINRTTTNSITAIDVDGDSKDEALIDFVGYGFYLWDRDEAEPWTFVNPTSANSVASGDIDGDLREEAIIDFGPAYGIFTWDRYDAVPWVNINGVSADAIAMADIDDDDKDEAVISFAQYGIYIWDKNAAEPWTPLNDVPAESIAEGDFDGDSLTYTWKFDGQKITAATFNTLYGPDYAAQATIGTHTVEISISDGVNAPVSRQWSLRITRTNLPPRITSYTPSAAIVTVDIGLGEPLVDFSITTSDPDNDPLTYTWKFDGQTLPSVTGTVLRASDYSSRATVGDHTVKVFVNDGHNADVTHEWTLRITQTVNNPPVINSYSPSATEVTIDLNTQNLIDFSISATDFENDPLTYRWRLDGQTLGSVTGNTLASADYSALATVGDHTVESSVKDQYHPFVTRQWTLHVVLNNPPTIDSFSPAGAMVNLIQGDSKAFSVTASDADNNPLTYSWKVNGAAVGGNSSSYTFAANQAGQFTVRITVTDGIGAATPPYHEWTVNVESILEATVKRAFRYFWDEADATTGLVRDRVLVDAADPASDPNYNMASMAATGFGLAALCVAAERYGNGTDPDWQVTPQQAADRAEQILDTLLAIQANQAPSGDAVWGKDGFFYHFVNMDDGRRWANSEVSSIDTAILVAGALTAGEYFGPTRASIRTKSRQIYSNVKWSAFADTTPGMNYKLLYKQWMPVGGYNNGHWDFSDEGILLYLLGIGSPNAQYALGPEYYHSFTRKPGSYGANGRPLVETWYGSLFAYQFAHAFFDLQDRHDSRNVDWWQSARDAAVANRQFCIGQGAAYGYSQNVWGLSSSYLTDSAVYRGEFGAPPLANPSGVVHDGTVNPSVVASAIGVLPLEVENALTYWKGDASLWRSDKYGFVGSFKNANPRAYADYFVGIDLGSTVAMVANHIYTGLVNTSFMNAQTRYGTMQDLLAQLGFRPNTDNKHYIDMDDITEKAQFAYGFIDSVTPAGRISFNMAQAPVANSKYLLAIQTFMNNFVGNYDVQVNVNVNGADRGSQTFSHAANTDDPIKYIEIDSSDLRAGENIVTLTRTSGTSWLGWRNAEISSPVITNTWAITRSIYATERRLDDTYFAGHAALYGAAAYKTFEQAVNRVTDPYTDILFYVDDLSRGRKLTLSPYSSDGTVYVDAAVNGQALADNLNMNSNQEIYMAAAALRQGWNSIRLTIDNAGGEWIIWNTVELDLGPSMLPPQGLVGASFGKTAVNLRWLAVNGSNIRYNVYRSQTAGGPYSKVNVSALPSPQYQDIGLQNGTTYYYVVTVFESAAPADESEYSSATAVKIGSYELDYGDGHDPNVFGGNTLDNAGSPLGDNAYVTMARYNGEVAKVRRTALAANNKNTIGLNNSNISDATIFSFRVRGEAGQERFQVKLTDGSGGQAQVALQSPLANTWQEMHLYINDTFSGVNLANVAAIEIIEAAGQAVTLYFDEVEFNTVDLAGDKLDVRMRTGTDDSLAAAIDFGNNPAGASQVMARQYLEIRYTSSATWGIQVYTNNKSPDASPRFTGTGGIANGLVGTRNSGYRVPVLWQVWQAKKGYYNGSETPEFDTTVDDGDRAEFAFVIDKGDANWEETGFQRNYRTLFNSAGELGAPVPLADPPPGYWPRQGTVGNPLYVYLGADFSNVPAQTYTTNKLTLDIYHS